jgi:hypothetical protein
MKRILYTLGVASLLFEGYVVYEVTNPRGNIIQVSRTIPTPPEIEPLLFEPIERDVSYHAKNIPATFDPVYSALKKEPIIGAKQSAIVWQQIFSQPITTYKGAR